MITIINYYCDDNNIKINYLFYRVANEFICPVFKWGTEKEWEFGLQRVINFPQNSPERKQNERTYLLKSLAGCPKDTYKIER